MLNKRSLIAVALAVILFHPGYGRFEEENRASLALSGIIAQYPAQNALVRDYLSSEILRLGRPAILELCRQLAPPGGGDDAAVRFALSGLGHYVSRPGAAGERRIYSQALLKALEQRDDKEVQAFLIRRLQMAGDKQVVKALGKYLRDYRLCEPTAQALLAIRTEEAEKVLLKSLDSAGRSHRITIMNALGELRSRKAVKKILPFAASRVESVRQAAMTALANIGDPAAESVLTRIPVTADAYTRAQAPNLYLLYARRRAEQGDPAACAAICRKMVRSYSSPHESQIASAALSLLVEIEGENAKTDLLAAMASPSRAFRDRALLLAEAMAGDAVTSAWIQEMGKTTPEVQAEILGMLGRRGDETALPVVREALASGDPMLRSAAITAAVRLGGYAVMPDLLPLFQTDEEIELKALKAAFLQFPPHEAVNAAAEIFNEAPPAARAVLIEILSAREARKHAELVLARIEDEDENVRSAAMAALPQTVRRQDLPRMLAKLAAAEDRPEIEILQSAVVASALQDSDKDAGAVAIGDEMERHSGQKRIALLQPMARLGGDKALAIVTAEMGNPDSRVRTAALYALSRWPDAGAAETLSEIFRTTDNSKYRYLALQGYIRLVTESDLDPQDRFRRIAPVIADGTRLEEKRLLINGLASVRTVSSLEAVAAYLDNPETQSEAVRSIIRIALPHLGEKGLSGKEVTSVLARIIPMMDNEFESDRVRGYLQTLKNEEGFAPLFNGRDLSGWIGNRDGYVVEAGSIVVRPERGGGNLYTEKEYADFILRFEFKLTPGANNGLGIRAPLEGDAAYVGMELQILDNTAPKYKNLKPYQYHGSIYGVTPARRGYLKPVGQWNSQEVVAKGSRIKVVLNGVPIVDTDIAKAVREGTMDGQDHPGLGRTQGHIGFLGHGSRVEFRNIRIKELD